jgi:hypothetical protein
MRSVLAGIVFAFVLGGLTGCSDGAQPVKSQGGNEPPPPQDSGANKGAAAGKARLPRPDK